MVAPRGSPARPGLCTISTGATAVRTISARPRIVIDSRPARLYVRPAPAGDEHAHDAFGEILDVDERALLVARASDRQRARPAPPAPRDEARDDRGRPRAVRTDPEAHRRRLDAVERRAGATVQLARQLAGALLSARASAV